MSLIPKYSRVEWGIVILLICAYFLTRLFHLTSFPIFVDEAIYSRWSQIALHDASWRFISLTDGKQPLFVWASMATLKVFTDPLFATRFTSVISGFLTLLGLLYSGHLLKNKKLGFFAATLSIFTPFLFFYDRFAVMESMLTAGGIWLFNLGIILCSSLALDAALILGLSGGLALLIKSPALIYLLLIPLSYPFISQNKLISGKTLRFGLLFLLSFGLAAVIYNIQRLSPWMHMISAKNADFVVSPLTMLKDHPFRIWQNFADANIWLWSYLTPPLYLATALGFILLLQSSWRQFMLLSAWFWGPLVATITTAMLFRPRYIVFIVPYALVFAAYPLTKLKKSLLILVTPFFLILPLRFFSLAYFEPLRTPLVRADWDYTSGWAAGSGVKEIAAYLTDLGKNSDVPLAVYTEGTFGLLPHGLELYTYGAKNLAITGLYPLDGMPPSQVLASAQSGIPTYFITNNTQVTQLPDSLIPVLNYAKADGSQIRLFRVINP